MNVCTDSEPKSVGERSASGRVARAEFERAAKRLGGVPVVLLHRLHISQAEPGIAGIGAAFLIYRGRRKDPLHNQFVADKFKIDELYAVIVKVFQDTVAYIAKALDQIFIDGLLVRGLAALTAGSGSLLRRLQVGNLQGYAFLFGLGVIAIIYFLIISV